MPTATRPKKPVAPIAKRRPSAAARSESGYSRRSSLGSFKTAAGASEYTSGLSAEEHDDDDDDDDDDENNNNSQDDDDEPTVIRSSSQRQLADAADSDEADETETVSRHPATPKGLVAARAEPDENNSSQESDDAGALFNPNASSDTDTIHKSPPTSHDDAASHDTPASDLHSPLRTAKSTRRELLTPEAAALTPKGRDDRKYVRASHASHLTLPYQRSEAGDYLDASRRLSKMTIASYTTRRAASRAASFVDEEDEVPEMHMRDARDARDARFRSVSERGGSRSSRLALPASLRDFGGSVRNSFQSQRGPGSRYASSYMEPSSLRSPSKRDTLSVAGAGIYQRDSDRQSISSRHTARKPASLLSKQLDADTQVYPGTRIRKYIEPQLNEAMRRVMKQFSGHGLHDHRCNGYPIAVFVGATALDTGSIIQPHVSGAVSLYFGPGHPKNMASLLPDEDRTPSHIPNPKAPNPASLSRRAELRSTITALHTIYELYRGRACAHVCIDSAYVAKAWGTWIPTWELDGWPGEDDEREGDNERWEEEYYQRRRNQRRAYDRSGTRYMDLPGRRDRGSEAGYASEGGRFRTRDSRAPPGRRHYDDRDDWLASDPYADRSRRRAGPSPQSPRRRGGRSSYDYSSDEDDYHRRRGGRRAGYDDEDRRRGGPYSPERGPSRRRPMRRAPGRRLVDEDLLRELADIRYEFARVERDRRGSAHLYLIDRSNNPSDRMARAVAKSEGSLLRQQADDLEARSELGLHVDDDAALSDDERLLDDDDEEHEWADTRSQISRMSKSTRAGAMSSRNSTRGSIISNANGRLRTSASLPSGHLRGAPRRQLDTFAEEDEQDLADDARSVRTHRSERSRKSTRAERERDDYLARQQRLDAEAAAAGQRRSTGLGKRSASRASHLAPPAASERGGGSRRSLDSRSASRMSTDVLSPEAGSRRGSMDARRVSAVRSQPDIRARARTSVRGALASAALRQAAEDEEEDDYRRPRGSMQLHRDHSGGPRHPRSRIMAERNDDGDDAGYPEIDDLVPPARVWDAGSVRSRTSLDSRRRLAASPNSPSSPRKPGLFGTRAREPKPSAPQSPRSERGFGLFSNRSTPSLHRSPAPEDEDYEWSKSASPRKGKGKHSQRQWHSTTPNDYADPQRSHWDTEEGTKKAGFFGRMFGRKK